ncbi:MAG: GntR family transcriptional regulator [bacterium]|nr:GntR family transcriptional regulator [bacterium]
MIRIDLSQPIYQQIMDGITKKVVRGELVPGDQIPSQREMAQLLRVSPNTVQRAYRDLEALGVVHTLRGQGTFIRAAPDLIGSLREEMLRRAVTGFAREMRSLACGREDILRALEDEIKRGDDGDGTSSDDDRHQ